MRLLRTLADLATLGRDVYLAIGVFDGVHLGHQKVIGQARNDARTQGGTSAVLTFDPHPIRVLRPQEAPVLLTSTAHKLKLIDQLGVDACLLVTFDKSFSETTPEEFIRQIACCRQVSVGTRFRFGHNRDGNVALIEKLAPQYGFAVKEIKSVLTAEGEMISSTAVRKHVLAGNLDRAAAMLGRPFSIIGTAEPGDQRGRTLGFPTANLSLHNEALPPNGVYAVQVRHGAARHAGVVNIGMRPTFAKATLAVEVHLLDFAGDLYGQDLELEFVQKLRDERKFASVEELKAQIAADVTVARAILR